MTENESSTIPGGLKDLKDGSKESAGSLEEQRNTPLDTVVVIAEFRSDKQNTLNLHTGDTIYVFTKSETGWWDGVIFSENGTLRGWFPNHYTKSLIVQDNKKHSNLRSLLRHNLESGRKNSTVSFASSEQSFQSDARGPTDVTEQSPEAPPVARGVSGASETLEIPEAPEAPVSLSNITVVSAQEVEDIFSSTGSSNVPIWMPVQTTENTLIYYNSELNIYCKDLPYIETPEVDDSTQMTIATKDQDPVLLTKVNLQAHSNKPYSPHSNIHRSSVKTRPSTVTSYDGRKDSATSRSRSSLPSTSTAVHPWNTSLYCEPDLFYYDPTDIKTWSGLRDAFIYFLTLTQDALKKKVGPLYYTYFNIASRLGVLFHLSARLAQHDLQKSGYQNRVQRRLKKIASSIAQVGINGNLYLTEPSGLRNFSTSTQDTIKPDMNSDAEDEAEDEKDRELQSLTSESYLRQVETEIDNLKKSAISCVKVFIQVSSINLNEQNYLPQVYPRFLNGFFSGGNWKNPFVPEPKDPFAGKEVVKSLHHKTKLKSVLDKDTFEFLEDKKAQLKQSLNEALVILREQENTQQRNVEILSNVYKSLTISTKFIDIIEGLDFSIFLNNRRDSSLDDFDPSKLIYPVLTEFFESKQNLRDVLVNIIMESQYLTLFDPTVFKSIREDQLESSNKFANVEPEKTAKELEIELQKHDVERDHGVSVDADKNLVESILKYYQLLDVSTTLIQHLISERDTLLSYATRVMNDGFQFDFYQNEREDSTLTNTDEITLPACATNRHIQRDVPWYLETEEFNLIFTNNDMIKGGTREALIQRLTHHDLLDATFNLTFLTTFRSMMKASTLIELLIKRFNILPDENLDYEEYKIWVEKKSYPIKLRVVNIMKSLLQKYWVPNYNDSKLEKTWGPFIAKLVEQNFPSSLQLQREFDLKVVDYKSKPVENDVKTPEKPFPARIRKMKLFDNDPSEFANQLTIKDSSLYSKISQYECLDKSWNKKYGSLGGFENLQKFISNSNDLTNFVSTQIINQSDIKKRVNIINYFVIVAEKCKNLNNFSSMTAIVSALYSSPIHRLKRTWKLIPSKTYNNLTKMNELMNSSRNFSEYREHLRFISDQPCVPFLGVFLSDLTFTTNGNPDHLHGDSKLVNFAKRTKTVDILREISRYQNLKYNLKKNDEVQDFINYSLKHVLNIDEQYSKSLVIEPRIKVSQQIQKENRKAKVSAAKSGSTPRPAPSPQASGSGSSTAITNSLLAKSTATRSYFTPFHPMM